MFIIGSTLIYWASIRGMYFSILICTSVNKLNKSCHKSKISYSNCSECIKNINFEQFLLLFFGLIVWSFKNCPWLTF